MFFQCADLRGHLANAPPCCRPLLAFRQCLQFTRQSNARAFDIQDRVRGETFNVTRRDQEDRRPRELDTGGSKEINKRILETFNLD